jgi:hypothetical protein
MSKTKTTKKKAAAPKATKSAKAAPAKMAAPKKATPAKDATPVADPCAKGHQWDTDGDGVEFCTVCKGDRKELEKAEKKAGKTKAKPAAKKKASAEPKEKKLSAIDAAAKVLAQSKEPLNAKQMIDAMSAKGYWTSPGGKTPHATLYSAILREITVKGKESRFVKTDRGQFTINA